MERGQMRVRVVVHDQVNTLDVLVIAHGEIALDEDRDDPAIFGHQRHVQLDMTPSDWPRPEELLQDPGNLLIGDLGVFEPGSNTGCSQQPLRARGEEPGGCPHPGPEKGSALVHTEQPQLASRPSQASPGAPYGVRVQGSPPKQLMTRRADSSHSL